MILRPSGLLSEKPPPQSGSLSGGSMSPIQEDREMCKKANMKELAERRSVTVAKVLLTVLGIGIVAGAAITLSVHGVVKKMFVNEKWPGEEWSSDDWAEEELEN